MRSMRAADMVEYFASTLGISGGYDNLYLWIEEALHVVREQKWPWNWKSDGYLSYAGFQQPLVPFYTWTEGDRFIVSSKPVAIDYTMTGRRVLLGDEWYTVLDFGLVNANRIGVDRPIVGSEATGVELTFYRGDLTIQTTAVRQVKISGQKIPRYSQQYFSKEFWGTILEQDVGDIVGYIDRDFVKLPPPAFPPKVVDSTLALSDFSAGDYYYFFTRFDAESGLESKPGPAVKYVAPADKKPRVTYDNPSGNKSENTSYGLRLYRSTVNPSRARMPMFRLTERSPFAAAGAYDDVNKNVYGLTSLWDGNSCTLFWLPPPDNTRVSVVVESLDNWCFRLYEEEYIDLGTNDQVLELVRVFLTGVLNLSSRNTGEYRQAVIHFRNQMAWLASEARASGDNDVGPENRAKDFPDYHPESGDWVDGLRWKD